MSRLAYGCLGLLGYTYAGYPAAIALLARLRPMQVAADTSYLPRVSVLIPVFDAERYVRAKLESVLAQDYPRELLEIIVYSDASTDGSDDAVRAFADRGVQFVRGEERRGKPTALNVMRARATGEVLVLTDIRQPLVPGAVRALVAPLADPEVGTVSGNLELVGGTGAGAYWRYENFLRKQEAQFRGMCGVTGPLYAIRRSDLGEVPDDIVLDDMWIPLGLGLSGKKLVLAEGAIAYDEAFEDDREKGRKVRTLAGNFQIFERLPALLSPVANPTFFETFSHKALRLAGPALMAGAVAGAVGGALFGATARERGRMRWLLAGQAGFAALAALGPRAGAPGKLARTFVVLNGAVVEGFLRHVRTGQKVTW